MTLAAGSLFLKDGVTFTANTFTQTAGSALVMDVGTTLAADTEGVTLNHLAINLASMEGTKVALVKASAADKNVTVSGPIHFLDSDGYYYENHSLSKSQEFSFLEFSALGTVTLTNVPAVPVESHPQHFGYQGTWALTWVPDTTSSPKTNKATATWTKTGYIPNPERRGPLVPNSLWGAFVDIRGLQAMLERSANTLYQQRGFWVAGLANFLHKDKTETRRGYRHTSAGYVLGAGTQTASEDVFQVAFCQLFGRDQDHLVAKNRADMYSGAVYYQHTGVTKDFSRFFSQDAGLETHPLVLEAQLAYGHTSNEMKTRYTRYSEVQGNWGNDMLSVELGGRVLYSPKSVSWLDSYAPYVKLQVVYAHQEDFEEQGREGRVFTNSNLFNVAVPLGLRMEKFLENEEGSFDVTVAYVPDVIRSNPDSTTSLVISGVSWKTLSADLSRQAVVFRGGSHYALGSELEVFGQCAFELRGSSRSYTIDLGGKLHF
ncbi:polymorphic outer membrane protein middle domain-containing protein [Candidatus Chlamydia sanziniae]|uniref:polymorphic outer membrane protein middle domain-containing protein n=1 Tax=Candidatus Chlamydia sanziniae TaxID=1806891 RepID=UPI000A514930|nr:polymorphic outer membrane protein middle domain-containing protein [Candidatus Chlamydia sanziniae]